MRIRARLDEMTAELEAILGGIWAEHEKVQELSRVIASAESSARNLAKRRDSWWRLWQLLEAPPLCSPAVLVIANAERGLSSNSLRKARRLCLVTCHAASIESLGTIWGTSAIAQRSNGSRAVALTCRVHRCFEAWRVPIVVSAPAFDSTQLLEEFACDAQVNTSLRGIAGS